MRLIEEILSDINKAKSKVTSVELEIGHTTGVSSQIDRLIQAQNLLTYCHSRLCEAAPRWIPVTERLPEPFVSVLVQMPGEKPFPTVREGFLSSNGIWHSALYDREPDEVTHWMPMPQPPEDGGAENAK